jgi:hypothetical protein
MIAVLRTQLGTGSIIQPEPPLLWLVHWHFKPLAPTQMFDTFVIHLPTRISWQGRDPAIATSTLLAGQLDHVCDQAFFIGTDSG